MARKTYLLLLPQLMKLHISIWYLLLFLVTITGTLASMALNDYGMKLMGIGCAGFALVFIYELVVQRSGNRIQILELVALVLLCGLLACRNFFIEIPAGQKSSAMLAGFLALMYLFLGIRDVRDLAGIERKAALGMAGFYGAVVSFLIGFVAGLSGFSPDAATVVGALFMVLFAGCHIYFRSFLMRGEQVSILRLGLRVPNKANIVLTALLVTGFFFTLIQYHVLPPLHGGDMPVGYTRLIQRAESGMDPAAAKGTPRHRDFRKAYEQFLERNK